MQNHYEVLGVQENASAKEIRSSFMKLMLNYHPDKANSKTEQKKNTEICCKLQAAYDCLKDDSERAYYDKILKESNTTDEMAVCDTIDYCGMEIDSEGDHTHPCRCGGAFLIDESDFEDEDVAYVECSSCSLIIKITK